MGEWVEGMWLGGLGQTAHPPARQRRPSSPRARLPRQPAQCPELPCDPHVTPRGAGLRGCRGFLARALRRSRQERVCLPRGLGPRGGGGRRKGGGLCLRASRRSAGGQGWPELLAAPDSSVIPGCLQPRLGPWSSRHPPQTPDPTSGTHPAPGEPLQPGRHSGGSIRAGGGIHMESGSEPRTRASLPSA